MSKSPDIRAGVTGLSDKDRALGGAMVAVFLIILSVVPYLQTLKFDFVNYDDPLHVSAQPAVLEGVNSESIGWAAKATPSNLWHPLTWFSYMAEVQWFGGGAESPGVHHGGNLLLYALTILFFYLLVRGLGVSAVWALIGVLLFALHPLHSEPVAWISARKDLLSGVFVMGSLLGYVRSGSAEGRARLIWKSLSLIAFAAALLSKPSAVVLPVLLILLDWFPLRQGGFGKDESEGSSWKPIFKAQLRSKGLYFVMALVAAVIAVSVQGEGSHRDFASESSLTSRLADAPGHLAFYLQRLVWPTKLIFEYSRPDGFASTLYPLAGVILVLGISWFAWTRRRRLPEIMLAWLWILVCLSPVLGFFYIGDSYTADRYLYLALMGPALATMFLLPRVTRWRSAVVPGSMLVLLVLGMLSFKQTKVWRNDSALFHHAVAVDPHHLTALGNLGSYYRVQKDDNQALIYYMAALEVNPNDHIVHYNIAHIRHNQGDRAGSVAALRACLDGYPNYGRAHHFLGVLLVDAAHKETYLPDEGLAHLKKACELNPQEPRYALNYVYNLHRQGRQEEAREATVRALKELPPGATSVTERLKKWLGKPSSRRARKPASRSLLHAAPLPGIRASASALQVSVPQVELAIIS
ncbi:tetratricopeptide repeat protein [Verrucomicrobiaceae bacterium 227]